MAMVGESLQDEGLVCGAACQLRKVLSAADFLLAPEPLSLSSQAGDRVAVWIRDCNPDDELLQAAVYNVAYTMKVRYPPNAVRAVELMQWPPTGRAGHSGARTCHVPVARGRSCGRSRTRGRSLTGNDSLEGEASARSYMRVVVTHFIRQV